jgi:hypothetical protein
MPSCRIAAPQRTADALDGFFHPGLPGNIEPETFGDAVDDGRIEGRTAGVNGCDQLAGTLGMGGRRAWPDGVPEQPSQQVYQDIGSQLEIVRCVIYSDSLS